jgi:hypothetical protein
MTNLGEVKYHCCHLPRGTCTTRACSGGSSFVAAHSSPLPYLPAGAKLSTTSSAKEGWETGQRWQSQTIPSLPSVRCERAFLPHYPLRCRNPPTFGALYHAKPCLPLLGGSAEPAHQEATARCCQRVARAARHKPVAPCQPAKNAVPKDILACIEGAWKRCKPFGSSSPASCLPAFGAKRTPPSRKDEVPLKTGHTFLINHKRGSSLINQHFCSLFLSRQHQVVSGGSGEQGFANAD